jgi:hypothetical protein
LQRAKPSNGRAGTWLAKWSDATRRTESGTVQRRHTVLGTADDIGPADGLTRLSFEQARTKAFEFFTKAAKGADKDRSRDAGELTVSKAIDLYVAEATHRGDRSVDVTEKSLRALVEPVLGSVLVTKLAMAGMCQQIRTFGAARSHFTPGRLSVRRQNCLPAIAFTEFDSCRPRRRAL